MSLQNHHLHKCGLNRSYESHENTVYGFKIQSMCLAHFCRRKLHLYIAAFLYENVLNIYILKACYYNKNFHQECITLILAPKV